jgi:hypothetical protein
MKTGHFEGGIVSDNEADDSELSPVNQNEDWPLSVWSSVG